MVLWLYDQPMQPLLEWLMKKFRKSPPVMAANGASLARRIQLRQYHRTVPPSFPCRARASAQGRYRRVTGNEALALGLIAACCRAERPIVYASYPITPASEILHELSARKEFDVRVLQCEDEIAACCAALGASFAGALGMTGTSGPGLALKTGALGLAVMTELPLW